MLINARLFRLAQNGRYAEALAAVKAYRADEETPEADVWLYRVIEEEFAKQVPPDPWAWLRKKGKEVVN